MVELDNMEPLPLSDLASASMLIVSSIGKILLVVCAISKTTNTYTAAMSLQSDARTIDDFGQDSTKNGSNRFLVFRVDGLEVLVTAAIAAGLAPRWHADCSL